MGNQYLAGFLSGISTIAIVYFIVKMHFKPKTYSSDITYSYDTCSCDYGEAFNEFCLNKIYILDETNAIDLSITEIIKGNLGISFKYKLIYPKKN